MPKSTCCIFGVGELRDLRTIANGVEDSLSEACVVPVPTRQELYGPPPDDALAQNGIICKNHYSNPGTLYEIAAAVQRPWT